MKPQMYTAIALNNDKPVTGNLIRVNDNFYIIPAYSIPDFNIVGFGTIISFKEWYCVRPETIELAEKHPDPRIKKMYNVYSKLMRVNLADLDKLEKHQLVQLVVELNIRIGDIGERMKHYYNDDYIDKLNEETGNTLAKKVFPAVTEMVRKLKCSDSVKEILRDQLTDYLFELLKEEKK